MSPSTEHDVQVDEIFHKVGYNGRYQKLLFWFFLVPLNTIIPWTALVQVFQASVPDHWCYFPGRPDNVSLQEWKNLTIPREQEGDSGAFSKCLQFVDLNTSSYQLINNTRSDDSSRPVTGCRSGWYYDDAWYDKTLATERDWVCDRDSFTARWLSAGIVGNLIGTLLFSCIADHWGRKVGIILTTQTYAVFALVRLFVTSEWGDLVLIFLSSMPFASNLEVSLIWVTEQVAPGERARITSTSFIMWTLGMCLVPLMAWLTRDWVLLGILTSVPFLPFLAIWWVFPESPRWLLSKGKVDKAFKAFERIAKYNQLDCPNDLQNTLMKLSEAKDLDKPSLFSFGFIELLKQKVVRKRLLLVTMCYVCNNLMYYGIIFNTSNLSGNEFLNFFYLSISELPGNILAWVSAQKIGRRFSEVGFFFLATITALISIFLAASGSWSEICVLVVCKTLVNVSFLVTYIQAAELLPTSHRSAGFGFASIVASIVGISTPYIAYSGSVMSSLPYIILTLIGLVGTVTALFLPETLGQGLPLTVNDAEVFLVDQSFWSYQGWRPYCCRFEEAEKEIDKKS